MPTRKVLVLPADGARLVAYTDSSGDDQQAIVLAFEDGSLVPGDVANGIDVDVTRLLGGVTKTATGGTHEGLAVAPIDKDGDLLAYAKPGVVSAATGSARTYGAGEAIGTVLSFSNAAVIPGGTGNIYRATFFDFDDLVHDGSTNGRYRLDLYSASVGVTDGSSYSAAIDDTEGGTYIDSIDTADGTWVDLGALKVCTVRTSMPLAYKCAATTLFGVLVAVLPDSGATSANGKRVDLQLVAD